MRDSDRRKRAWPGGASLAAAVALGLLGCQGREVVAPTDTAIVVSTATDALVPCRLATSGQAVQLDAWLVRDAAGRATGVHLVLVQLDGTFTQWPLVYAEPADAACPGRLVDPPWTDTDIIGELIAMEGTWPLPDRDTRLVGVALRAGPVPDVVPCGVADTCLDLAGDVASVSETFLVDVP